MSKKKSWIALINPKAAEKYLDIKAGEEHRCIGCPAILTITIDHAKPVCSSCQGKLDARTMCPKCWCEGGITHAQDHGEYTPMCTYCGWWLELGRYGDGKTK